MIKIKKIYSVIGMFIIVFLSFFVLQKTEADVTIWQYSTSPVPHTYTFKTQLECGNNRALYLQNTRGQATLCESVISAGYPTVTDVYEISAKVGEDIIVSEKYTLLAPIGNFKDIKTNDIGEYFNKFLSIAIGLAGALAVVMIIIGGIEWMGTDSVFAKTEAKKRITSAILGLLIALGSYALLNTINPDLLGRRGLNIDQVNIKLEGDTNAPVSLGASGTANLSELGITCTKSGGFSSLASVAKSFNGKMTYSQDIPKGQLGGNNTVKYDCSGFVNAVLLCSGINTSSLGINSGTSVIFSIPKAEKVTSLNSSTVNGKELKVGDLVGWKPSDDKDKNGHVMVYIGNGLVADSHSPKNKTGKAYGEFSLEKYKDRIKYVIRTSEL
jgi:hypothetical protein